MDSTIEALTGRLDSILDDPDDDGFDTELLVQITIAQALVCIAKEIINLRIEVNQ